MSVASPTMSHLETGNVQAKVRWRLPLLILLMLICIAWNVVLGITAPVFGAPFTSFLLSWGSSFVPYILACIVVLATPALTGRWRWVELACILVGALVLRVLFVPNIPNLSGDSWRYIWDARITLHGFSPYVYAPDNPALVHLHNFIYDRTGYRDVPSLYPPAAQAVYLLSYLLAPDSMIMLKSIFVVFEMGTCIGLVILLRTYGMDMSRCIIYAWCPLPIMEFALQGHHEVIGITFTVLALVCATRTWRLSALLTGLFIALAALTDLYPILLLLVAIPRRKWSWIFPCVIACVMTIVLAYLPYIILGQGRVLGFFGTFASEQFVNAGPVLLSARWLSEQLHMSQAQALMTEYAVDSLVMIGVALAIIWFSWRGKMPATDAMLLFIATVFAASTHINPWYNAALVPWVAFMAGPLWTRQGWNPRGWAGLAAWYFACFSISSYYFYLSPSLSHYYYFLGYDVPLVLFLLSLLFIWQRHTRMAMSS